MRGMRNMLISAVGLSVLAACTDDNSRPQWSGTVDTLQSGQVVVHNSADPVWPADSAWHVVEELRIGQVEGEPARLFGRIAGIEVDQSGRIWVLEQQSQELRVFAPSGDHIRTIGRKGGGPGEFAQAVHVEQARDGNLWVMDPQNNRVSVYDTTGTYLTAHTAVGGFVIMPWPGGFDTAGHYYAPVPHFDDGFRVSLVRFDTTFAPRDTLTPPTDPVQRERFEVRSPGGGGIMAGVPFQGGLSWQLSRRGTIWALVSDEYRLFEIDAGGDTLRTVTRAFEPMPVTNADREQAAEDLKWFTDQGGRIDLGRLPSTKPPVRGFVLADDGSIWVEQETDSELRGRRYDIFDPTGRYLGLLELPFRLLRSPAPIIRDAILHGVAEDDLGVQYIVRARIEM